jgi:poly-gamma-glutamate synthesis protein (capsule biosynthesis protein)
MLHKPYIAALILFMGLAAARLGAETSLTLVAAGDNLYHDVMLRPTGKDGTYNYTPFYAAVRPMIEQADIAFINQETVLAGKEYGLSGYPRFNSPQELGETIVELGFDVVNHATNHVMDKGEAGVFATLDFWDKHPEVRYIGIHRSRDAEDTVILEKNGIRVGFLSYTYGTNGLPLPKDKPYLVSLIDTGRMAREIDALRPKCDFLVVSMHWGNEYEFNYSPEQERLRVFLVEHKVDLIIGHHPHVLQTFTQTTRSDGRTSLCFYSLGNFISSQERNITLLGGLMYVKIKKEGTLIQVEKAGVIPVVTHYERGFTNYQVYPLYEYTEALAAKHLRRTAGNEISPGYFRQLAQKVLGAALLDYNPFMGYKPNL